MPPKTSCLQSSNTYGSETEYFIYVFSFGTVLISKHYADPFKFCHLFYRFQEKIEIFSAL